MSIFFNNLRYDMVVTLAIPVLASFILFVLPGVTQAATFSMQSGYYVGDGTDNRAITGVGFQPELIFIKDDTTAGADGLIFRTGDMSGDISGKLAEAEVERNNLVQSFDTDGFTIGSDADVNSANVMYYWVAFAGSDCSSSGTFCYGSYAGNGTSQSITAVGFQPDLVIVKRNGASLGEWKSSAMAGTIAQYFSPTAQLASGGITSIDATGFSVGNNVEVNQNPGNYRYIAFKEVSGAMDVGSYTGNNTDNRNITSSDDAGLTFQPDYVFIKATTTAGAVASNREHYGDRSYLFTDVASAANHIQDLLSTGGFQIGNSTSVNVLGSTIYYAAFGGSASKTPGTGTFTMANGSYSGTGVSQSVTGLAFRPDLVIIKHNDQTTDQYAVFKTSLFSGDRTSYLANAATVFTGGITTINADGFTVGTNATVNTSGDTYYWTAFGNAMRPDKSGGSSDFLVGQYLGTAKDNTDIDRLPMQPDFVTIKIAGTTAGTWRTEDQSGDLSLFFAAAAQAANTIQVLNSDGFQIGTAANVGTSGSTYDYFAFKKGTNFETAQYTGTGSSQDITSAGFSPDLVWIKKTTGGTARGGVLRTSAQAGNAAQPFLNSPTVTNAITALLTNGFTVNTDTTTNENTFTYQYAVWKIPVLTIPTVLTKFASNVSTSAATLNAAISDDGGASITQHGFAYSTDEGLSTGVSTTTLGSFAAPGEYDGPVSSLSPNTAYYYRAYATTGSGTGYGLVRLFSTGNATVTRKIRLFEGFKVKIINNRIKLNQ